MKVYVTKFALSRGIMVIEFVPIDPDGLWALAPGGDGFRVGKDCYTDRGEAEEKARRMAERRTESLRRQISKMSRGLAVTPKWEETT